MNQKIWGIVSALFLVIMLNNYKAYEFLIHNFAGRFLLILLIIFSTSYNILLGILSVLYVIIVIDNNKSVYYEGFDTEPVLSKLKETLEKKNNDTLQNSSVAMVQSEGFNITEKEQNILKGKNSKQLPIVKKTDYENEVEPFFVNDSITPAIFY
jgi:c-di-AMP phosphodiesterase-like protein